MIANTIKVVTRYGYLFVDGVKYTLLLSLITVLCGTILGALLAFIRVSRFRIVRIISTVYIEIIRGTPLLLQLYFFYFLLPELFPFMDNKVLCVAVALVFNSSAYTSEIIRAGIQAVDRGQTEAALGLGLTQQQAMMKIVLPQAVKNILPALCNEFIMVIKETSLASTFFVGDIMTQYKVISGALYLVIEPLLVAGVIYFILTFSLSKLVAVFERRLAKGD